MEVEATGDVEAFMTAAKMPWSNINDERFVDATQHVVVPRGGFFGTDIPQTQIDVEFGAFDGGDSAEVEDVLQMLFCSFSREFGVGVCRKIDLTDCGRGENLVACTFDCGAVCRERKL